LNNVLPLYTLIAALFTVIHFVFLLVFTDYLTNMRANIQEKLSSVKLLNVPFSVGPDILARKWALLTGDSADDADGDDDDDVCAACS